MGPPAAGLEAGSAAAGGSERLPEGLEHLGCRRLCLPADPGWGVEFGGSETFSVLPIGRTVLKVRLNTKLGVLATAANG